MKSMAILLVLGALVGCSSAATPKPAQQQDSDKPHFTEDVFAVAPADARKFWNEDVKTVQTALERLKTDALDTGGCFRYEAIVDSDGRLFDVHPIQAFGFGDLKKAELAVLKNVRFLPTKDNVNRTPIKSTFDLSFTRTAGAISEDMLQKEIKQCAAKLDAQPASGKPSGI